MKIIFTGYLLLSVICQFPLNAQPFECGSQLPTPTFTAQQEQQLEGELQMAKQALDEAPQNADALIWYARRLGYLARYQQAIDVLTKGLELHPMDARMFRHRGHRYLTLRCTGLAIADFEMAARLENGKIDQVEPDGQPNEANIPTSTLHSNIYYHLGLAYYLQKDYAKAREAFEKCLMVSTNPDMHTATANWYYLTLVSMNDKYEATNLLATVDFEAPLLENGVYRKLLLLHRDRPSAAVAMETVTGGGDVQSATYLYGLYMYLKLNNHLAAAGEVKQQLMEGNQYASFGYIAAEMD